MTPEPESKLKERERGTTGGASGSTSLSVFHRHESETLTQETPNGLEPFLGINDFVRSLTRGSEKTNLFRSVDTLRDQYEDDSRL